ncbi:MAG: ABC transporter substrate-binding protein [Bacillota bacterium]
MRRVCLAVVVLLAVGLSGCIRAPSGTTGEVARISRLDTGVLRVGLTERINTLDPVYAVTSAERFAVHNLYSGLVSIGAEGYPVPELAESWNVSQDGQVYTFVLREGLTFHDGTPLTAKDVERSLTRALLKDTGAPDAMKYLSDIVGSRESLQGRVQSVAGIKVLDARTISITLYGPRAHFLSKLAEPVAYIVPETVDPERPVGSGPFSFLAWEKSGRVGFAAFPGYLPGPPEIERLEVYYNEDQIELATRYMEGFFQVIDVTPSLVPWVRDREELRGQLLEVAGPTVFYIGLNGGAYEPFADPLVRRAMALALDRETLVKEVWKGTRIPARGYVPPGIGGPAENDAIRFDPEEARRLLDSAGYKPEEMPELVICIPDAPVGQLLGEYYARSFSENLGLSIRLESLEWSDFLSRLYDRQMHAFSLGWEGDYHDPHAFVAMPFHSKSPFNELRYVNAEVDKLIERAEREADLAVRKELYRQAEALVLSDTPWIPVYHGALYYLVVPELRGLGVTSAGLTSQAQVTYSIGEPAD